MRLSVIFSRFILCTIIAMRFTSAAAQDAKYYYDQGEKFSRELHKENKYDSAILYYSKAVSLDLNFTPAYVGRGFSYIAKNLVDSALIDFTKAINLAPDSSDFYSYRAEAYFKKRNYDSAIIDYTTAIKLLHPVDTENLVINYGGRYRAYYFRNQIDSALKDVNILIGINPKFAGYYNNRALCYNSLGEYENSLEDFFRYFPNSRIQEQGNALINVISPLARMKRFGDANTYYNLYRKNNLQSFLEDSKYTFYHYFVNAVIQVNENKPEAALASLDTATREYGSGIKDETKRLYMDILFLNGYILEKLEKFEDAKINYQQALVLDARQPDIKDALLALQDKRIVFRNKDRTAPKFEELSVSEIVKFDNADNRSFDIVSDSVKFSIRGKAADDSGIDSVKVNGVPVDKLEEDGVFFKTLSVKAGTNSLVFTVTDKEKNLNTYIHKLAGATAVAEQRPVTTEPEGMGKFYAILIAEKDYIDSNFKDLQYPVRDANSLKDVLTSKYTFEEKNIDTLYNRSREDILETIIARCKALGKNDNLLIFYAGHGDTTQNIKGDVDGYLIPTSAVSNKISYYITSEEINKAILNSQAKHVLILLDACFSGSFTRDKGNDIIGDEIKQWELPSRKIMTSGNLSPVPDKSSFIVYLTEFLKNNNKKYVSTKDIWPFVDSRVRAYISSAKDAKFYDPQYAPVTGVGDLGGSFIFELRK